MNSIFRRSVRINDWLRRNRADVTRACGYATGDGTSTDELEPYLIKDATERMNRYHEDVGLSGYLTFKKKTYLTKGTTGPTTSAPAAARKAPATSKRKGASGEGPSIRNGLKKPRTADGNRSGATATINLSNISIPLAFGATPTPDEEADSDSISESDGSDDE